MTATTIPTDYLPGYAKARALDADMASNYIAHTTIGDPVMDALVEELATVPSLPDSQRRSLHSEAGIRERR